jgi:hypothetical protein
MRTGCVARQAFYSVGIGVSFPECKSAGTWSQPLTPSSTEVKNEWSYSSTPPYVVWRGIWLRTGTMLLLTLSWEKLYNRFYCIFISLHLCCGKSSPYWERDARRQSIDFVSDYSARSGASHRFEFKTRAKWKQMEFWFQGLRSRLLLHKPLLDLPFSNLSSQRLRKIRPSSASFVAFPE